MAILSDGSTTVIFFSLAGPDAAATPGKQAEEVTRHNVDGIALRDTGRRGMQFVLRGRVNLASIIEYTAFEAALQSLKGKIVTYVDDHGASHANLWIMNVRPYEPRRVITAVGGLSGAGGALWVTVDVEAVDTGI